MWVVLDKESKLTTVAANTSWWRAAKRGLVAKNAKGKT